MSRWRFHHPVEIHFGEGVLDGLAAAIRGRSFAIVTHPDAPMRAWCERIVDTCGEPVMTIDAIEPNPSLDMLQAVTARIAAAGVTPGLFVALGGGSVIDSTKFLAAGHGEYQSVVDSMVNGGEACRRALPFIAIPTTAGTGSDLTKWATVWDTRAGRKLSLERDDLYAESAFIDPLLMMSLPWPTTLASGLDALAHALESIWNVNANPVTRHYAVRAARETMAALPCLMHDPGSLPARSRMALGATLAGLAFSNTRTALSHNISYPITLGHGVAHGIACSFCLPEVMTAAIGFDPACDAALCEIFGDLGQAPGVLRTFLHGLGVPGHPEAFGIVPEEWGKVVAQAYAGARGKNFIGSPGSFPERMIA